MGLFGNNKNQIQVMPAEGGGGSKISASYVSWQDAQCKVYGKQILHPTDGWCKPGKALAILGPSGAGKSTLLDILARRKSNPMPSPLKRGECSFSVDLRFNGQPAQQLSRRAGYVTSDDINVAELTVLETLQFAAACRLERNVSPVEAAERVNDALRCMHLEGVTGQRVGSVLQRGLSTGERRRLQIAVELIPKSEVLFLDEPTTGLDSNIANAVVRLIVETARERNIAVVMTIHQPSTQVYEYFDDLLLLAQGRTVYFGERAAANDYFNAMGGRFALPTDGHVNPAEHYLETLAVDAQDAADRWAGSPERRDLAAKFDMLANARGSVVNFATVHFPCNYAAPYGRQLRQLAQRQVRFYARNKSAFVWRTVFAAVVALFLGILFMGVDETWDGFKNRDLVFFSQSFIPSLLAVANVPILIHGRKLYYQERDAGAYAPWCYFLVIWVVEVAVMAVLMTIFGGIMYFFVAWPSLEGRAFNFGFLQSLGQYHVAGVLFAASMSAEVPGAMAMWAIIYMYNLVFSVYFLPEVKIKEVCGSCDRFFKWLAPSRHFFVSNTHHAYKALPLTCKPHETVLYDLPQIFTDGTALWVRNVMDSTLAHLPNDATRAAVIDGAFAAFALEHMFDTTSRAAAHASVNVTYNPFLTPSLAALATGTKAQTLLAATGHTVANFQDPLPAPVAAVYEQLVNVALLSSPVGAAIFAGLPRLTICPYTDGMDYLRNYVGLTEDRADTSLSPVEQFNCAEGDPTCWIDAPNYAWNAGLIWLLTFFLLALSYLFLIFCKFQTK